MENNLKLYLPLNFNQILSLVKQLPASDKKKLIDYLKKDTIPDKDVTLTHFASEKVLAKDWLSPEEDEAWQDL